MNTDLIIGLFSFLIEELKINQSHLSDIQIEHHKYEDGDVDFSASLNFKDGDTEVIRNTVETTTLDGRSIAIDAEGLTIALERCKPKS